MIFGEMESAINLLGKVRDFLKSRQPRQEEATLAGRFVKLFESHGIQRNQIPTFFGHGLRPKDVASDSFLLDALTNEMIHDACVLFAVRREWLDGADGQIYPLNDFYKDPEAFSDFLDDLLSKNESEGGLHGVLLSQSDNCFDSLKDDALIILEEPIGTLGDKIIYRYHICNNWLFSYWKSRAYLAACIAIAWKKHVYILGRITESAMIRKYCQGENFLDYNGESSLPVRGKKWYPEDMTLNPEDFLEGIDPEKEDYGHRSALELWLKLEEDGLMDAGLTKNGIRKKFEDMQKEKQISTIQKMAG